MESVEPAPIPKKGIDGRVVFWVTFLTTIILDQIIKAWARHVFDVNLAAMDGKPFPGVFEFTLTYNRGIAFGMFQGRGIWLTPIALFMAGIAARFSHLHPKEPAVYHFAFALLASGALGNLIDRLAFGKVTDMFYFRLINFPVFNLADACISVSAALLIAGWGFELFGKSSRPTQAN